MDIVIAAVGGLIVGWLIEWVADRWFWRRRLLDANSRLNDMERMGEAVRTALAEAQRDAQQGKQARSEAERLRAELVHEREVTRRVRTEGEAARARAEQAETSLQFRTDAVRQEEERRAGIEAELDRLRSSLADARLEVERLKLVEGEVTSLRSQLASVPNPQQFAALASEMDALKAEIAGERQKFAERLAAASAEAATLREQVAQLEAGRASTDEAHTELSRAKSELEFLRASLAQAKEEQASLRERLDRSEAERARVDLRLRPPTSKEGEKASPAAAVDGDSQAEAELAQLRARMAEEQRRRERLSIFGAERGGPAAEAFEPLPGLEVVPQTGVDPTQAHEPVSEPETFPDAPAESRRQGKAAGVLRGTKKSSRAEVASKYERAADILKDNFRVINGIGPVFERRFNDAGIYTFAQLARLTPERARQIVKAKEWQKIEVQAWINEAELLAGLVSGRNGGE